MYIAKQTIILEDVFSRDNLYLKGHRYDLYQKVSLVNEYGISSRNLILSENDIQEYFTYDISETIAGYGNANCMKVSKNKTH